jgi:uncharacterized protein YvpB
MLAATFLCVLLAKASAYAGMESPIVLSRLDSEHFKNEKTPTPVPEPPPEFEVRHYGSSLILEPVVEVFASSTKPLAVEEEKEESFATVAAFARQQAAACIYWAKSGTVIWDNANPLPKEAKSEVKKIYQMPELPRGCEVTSLSMLLSAHGIEADKMELAERIAKTPYKGDPNVGFVGNMYDFAKSGYGVYHKPIYALLKEYEPELAIDLSGCEFEDILHFLASGMPVWVITNSWYSELPKAQFTAWETPTGTVNITWREHSVLLTGYDSENVYINDPLASVTSAKLSSFKKSWVQMGRQAVTIVRKPATVDEENEVKEFAVESAEEDKLLVLNQ